MIHAYTAGNEPYEIYEKFRDGKNKEEYAKFKEDRAACLWQAIEKEIVDVRSRVMVELVGTPLTHGEFYSERRLISVSNVSTLSFHLSHYIRALQPTL